MDDECDIDCTGTEDDVIERETDKALGAGATAPAAIRGAIGPLVRVILAFVAALGVKSVREALARAKALLAPVDVEAEVERLVTEALRLGATSPAAVRPLVEDRARLAREVGRLTAAEEHACATTIDRDLHREYGETAAKLVGARAEIARLTAELAERTTERDMFGRWYSGARAEVIERCEEIRRLAAELAGVRASYQARETDWRAGRVRLDPCETLSTRTAAPGEAWERLPVEDRLALLDALAEEAVRRRRWAAHDAEYRAIHERLAGVWEAARAALMRRDTVTSKDKTAEEYAAALAAVEPRVDAVTADPSAPRILALRRTLTGLRGFVDAVGRALIDDALVADNGAANGLPADWAITHDFRPGAQDGMPRLADVEAREMAVTTGGVWALPGYVGPGGCPTCENDPGQLHGTTCGSASPLTIVEQRESIASAPGQIGPRWPLCVDCSTDGATQHIRTEARPTGRCARCGNGGIMYAPPGWTASPAEVTDAELADAIERTSGGGPLAWPGSILRRLARAEQARRAAPAMTAERAREDLAQKIRGMSDEQKVELAPVFEEALAMRPTPPRALTEAEARTWAGTIWVRTSTVDHAWTLDVIAKGLLAASRGDVPPEVRPVVDPSFVQITGTHTFGGRLRSDVRPMHAPEMAVTTGEAERAPDACGHGTLSSFPCDDCDREMAAPTGEDAPTGVPSIAGPAGLDAASAPPPGYWDKGVAVERQSGTAQCVAVLVTDPAERVLLVLSSKGGDRGWELPGSKLDPGEDPRDGARREAIEETGLAVVLSTDEPAVLPRSARHRGALLFHGRAEGEPRPGSDAKEAMWFSANDVLWLDAHHMLSDLASRAVLLEWARGASSPAADATTHGPEARPRVGAWSAWEPPGGASIYDDHGLIVASAWETPDGWRWSANRPHLAPVQCSVPVSREEAESAAVIVLETWADVSAARGAQ